jgi:hypothetical protein
MPISNAKVAAGASLPGLVLRIAGAVWLFAALVAGQYLWVPPDGPLGRATPADNGLALLVIFLCLLGAAVSFGLGSILAAVARTH